jgi:hypothetical protein
MRDPSPALEIALGDSPGGWRIPGHVKMAIRTPSPMSSLRASGSSTKAEAPPFSLSLPPLVVVCSGIAVEVSTLSSWSWPASSGAVSLHNRPRDEDGEERDGGLEVSRETHCAGASAPPVSPNGIVGRSVAAVAAPEGILSVYDMRIDRSAFAIILLLSGHLSEPLFQPSTRFDLISPLCSALLFVRHRVFTRGPSGDDRNIHAPTRIPPIDTAHLTITRWASLQNVLSNGPTQCEHQRSPDCEERRETRSHEPRWE